MDINIIAEFLKNNIVPSLIILLLFLLTLLKPFRKFVSYCAKNAVFLAVFACAGFICSFLGYTVISLNIITVVSTLLLGLPGISLALFLSLVI
ncbi:MAG: hypothetical protein FWH10_02605 [Oscillospiraceae bacterium]|nr:hypothetical protein [Oscillospiraceae bacterium]